MIGTTFADLLLDYIKTAVLSRKKGACNLQTPLMVLRILSRYALRMTSFFVIAVRVSGGHLCEAEAPTEPAGETAERCAAIRSLPPSSLRGAFAPRQSVFSPPTKPDRIRTDCIVYLSYHLFNKGG